MSTAIHIELNALCILILYAIAHQTLANVNQQMNRVLFRCMVYGVIVQLALDILWRLIEGRVFPGAILANRVVNALYLSAGVVLGCILYLYVLETLGYAITRRLQTLVMIPGLLFLGLNIISIWTGWIFTVSPENVYAHGPLFWLQMIGAYGMMGLSLTHLIFYILRGVNRVPRQTVMSLLSFYFIPIVGAVVSLFYTGMPGVWTCSAVSLVLLYLYDQDNEIVRDGLTGLNNRKTLSGVYGEYVKQVGPQRALYLFMMDLDSFKQINDTMGHPVGDQALVAAANILSASMVGQKGILARYGGDEFLIMAFFEGDEAAEAFRRSIGRGFAEYRQKHNPPYTFSVSVGYTRYRGDMALEALVEEADEALYREKQRVKAKR
ncbi:MAG: diguanylate cyclase [Clostridia bacterium]|nr:diguanylate cyclase [Clostridia bacterium]